MGLPMHPLADLTHPAQGKPCWLVEHGNGSFVTMAFGQRKAEIYEPILMRVHIKGERRNGRRDDSHSSAVTGICGFTAAGARRHWTTSSSPTKSPMTSR